jgi:hypothetical protein
VTWLRTPGLVALALLLGCGDDADRPESAASPGDGVTASTAGAASSPGAPPASPPASDGSSAIDPDPTATTSLGSDPPPTLDASGPVGSFAPALLRPDLSERLVVEVHADDDVQPRRATVEHVSSVLGEVSGKPVDVVDAPGPSGGTRAWTSDELVAAADAGASTAQGGGVAVVRLLFVRGTFEGDDGVLGVAVRGDVAAVFVDRVEAAGGLLGGSEGIEVSVTTHEVGHLLGLVDLVLDTGRADPEHPGHSRNTGSVMYWAVESDVVGQLLGANPPRDFDADDRADLAAIAARG